MSLESRLKEEVSSYYENNDLGHKLSHVNNVLTLAFNIKDILKLNHVSLRDDLIIMACYYHDMYSSSDRENHAKEASEYVMVYSRDIDSVCNELSEEDRLYVAHAVLEHRASYKGKYSSPLSELLSAADRGLPNAVDILERVLKCTEDKNCIVKVEVEDADPIDKAVFHLRDKFSSTGYARYNKMYQQAYPIGLYTLQRCFDNITKEHVKRVLSFGMEKIRLLSNKEFYKFLYNDELFPVVKLTQLTSLENCDRAIGKCWNKQSEDGVNIERMDRVVNKNKHACYSEDTEILTNVGWKLIKNVSLDDKVCTLDPKSLQVVYHTPDRLFKYSYDGELINFKSRFIDLLVTPNHKVYVSDNRKKSNRDPSTRVFELIEASEVFNVSHIHTKASNGVLPNTSINYSIELMKLIGFFIGDGHKETLAISFNIRKPRKIEYLKNILEKLGYVYRIRPSGAVVVYLSKEISDLFSMCYINKEKRIPPNLLYNCTKEELSGILDGLINADGYYKLYVNGLYEISTTSEQLKEDLSVLAVHIGRDMMVSYVDICKHDTVWSSGKITLKENSKPCYYIRITTSSLYVRFNNNENEAKPVKIKYIGEVYCLEVTNHVLMTRRNGRMVWSGNSTVEHIVAGFDISDVSRLLLMEHTRHRIASISVKSTRYTLKELKEETEPFYDETTFHYQRARKYIKLTHDVRANRAAIRGLEEVRLLVHDGISNDVIKYALPESFLTEFEWTINFRSLKNYLKLRTDKSSHFEIRNLAYAIYDVIPKEYRFLLKDALYIK